MNAAIKPGCTVEQLARKPRWNCRTLDGASTRQGHAARRGGQSTARKSLRCTTPLMHGWEGSFPASGSNGTQTIIVCHCRQPKRTTSALRWQSAGLSCTRRRRRWCIRKDGDRTGTHPVSNVLRQIRTFPAIPARSKQLEGRRLLRKRVQSGGDAGQAGAGHPPRMRSWKPAAVPAT